MTLLLTTVFCILTIQSSTSASIGQNDPRNTYEYTLDKIEEINATLSVQIVNALKNLENDTDNAILLMTVTVNTGTERIQEVYANLRAELDIIKTSSEEEGIVTQCLDENEGQLENLLVKLTDEVSVCATTRANQAMEEIYTIINNVDSISDILSNLRTEVENCGSDNTCVVPVLQDVLKNFKVLPQEIDKGTVTADEVVNSLIDSLWSCIDERVAQMSTNGDAVIENIVDCINT